MNAAAVDHGWIRANLGWPLAGDEPITTEPISHLDGDMGGVERVECAGRSFVLKTPPDDDSEWGKLLADIGSREVEAYRLLTTRGPTAPKVSPDCYWSHRSDDGRGTLALEYLGPAPPLGTAMADGLGRAEALATVRCLAMAHAAFLSRAADPLVSPHPWLYTAESEGLIDAVRMGLEDLRRGWSGRCQAGHVAAVLDADVPALLHHAHAGGPASVCHGDAWTGNILFRPPVVPGGPPTAYLIDWQFAMWGNPLTDVALFMLSSLTPASRAAWQTGLLEHYHATLVAAGADVAPAECHRAFRRALPGAAIVALATTEGYTRGMTAEEVGRFSARVSDAMEIVVTASAGARG